MAAARRNSLPMRPQTPQHLDDILAPTDLVIAVCDNVHEELPADARRMHWSISDPTKDSDDAAFDRALNDLTQRIDRLAATLHAP